MKIQATCVGTHPSPALHLHRGCKPPQAGEAATNDVVLRQRLENQSRQLNQAQIRELLGKTVPHDKLRRLQSH